MDDGFKIAVNARHYEEHVPLFHLQGHRGARGLAPENTLPSFERAMDAGVSSVETDVFLSADGEPVLCHDPVISERLFRLAPGSAGISPSACPRIGQLSLSQIRAYVGDRNPDPIRFPDQQALVTPVAELFAKQRGIHPFAIPKLQDLIDFVESYAGDLGEQAGKGVEQRARAGQLIFDIEIKCTPFRMELGESVAVVAVYRALTGNGRGQRSVVRSFDHRVLLTANLLGDAKLRTAVLIAGAIPADPAAVAKAARASIYCPNVEFADREVVEQCHAHGIAVIPWTVNAPADWQRLLDWNIDGITTDYPDRLAEYLLERAIEWQ